MIVEAEGVDVEVWLGGVMQLLGAGSQGSKKGIEARVVAVVAVGHPKAHAVVEVDARVEALGVVDQE